MNNLKLVEVESGIEIPFVWRDTTPDGSNLGHAEFVLELDYKRGKLKGFYVFPAQQRNMSEYWHVSMLDSRDIMISSYHQLPPAYVWSLFWCKHHKMPAMSMYVPEESKYLWLDYNGLSFLKRSWVQ